MAILSLRSIHRNPRMGQIPIGEFVDQIHADVLVTTRGSIATG